LKDVRNPWQENEQAYAAYLQQERSLFAWCLRTLGGKSPADALQAAEALYTYEPSTDPHRGLVFHDEAWHWAMLQIMGPQYWVNRPELKEPSAAYRLEFAALSASVAT